MTANARRGAYLYVNTVRTNAITGAIRSRTLLAMGVFSIEWVHY